HRIWLKITLISKHLLLSSSVTLEQEMDLPRKTLESVQFEVADICHVLGKTWALVVLKNMSTKESIRFNDLKRVLTGISNTVLSYRLKEYENTSLISKKLC